MYFSLLFPLKSQWNKNLYCLYYLGRIRIDWDFASYGKYADVTANKMVNCELSFEVFQWMVAVVEKMAEMARACRFQHLTFAFPTETINPFLSFW